MTVRLRAGADTLELEPAIGGSVRAWVSDGWSVLRTSATACTPVDLGCFPLVPFANRIRAGRFEHGTRCVQLPECPLTAPHAHHGTGWLRPWEVRDHTASSATLEYRHRASEWPWAFVARQRFTLEPGRLLASLALRNVSDERMPAGIGLHPHIALLPGATLRFGAESVVAAHDGLPIGAVPLDVATGFAAGRVIDEFDEDRCYDRWDGNAELAIADGRSLRIEAVGAVRCLHVFVPRGRGFCALEPVSHVPDAMNDPAGRHGTPMLPLAPGRTVEMTVSFTAARA